VNFKVRFRTTSIVKYHANCESGFTHKTLSGSGFEDDGRM